MKRAATLVLVMLAMSARAAVDARALELERIGGQVFRGGVFDG